MRRALCALLLAATAGLAAAQQQTPELTPAQRCLTLSDQVKEGAPSYPFQAFKNDWTGRVKVQLRFGGPDQAPALEVLEEEGEPQAKLLFVDAVRDFARHYRVPCLAPADVPALLRVEYVFRPDSRKVLHGPLEQDERPNLWTCRTHVSGNSRPDYPWEARRRGVQGRVIARLRFTAPDQAPEVDLAALKSAKLLGEAVGEWAKGYRLPCLGSTPYQTTITFVFRFEEAVFGFTPGIGLAALLGNMPEAGRRRIPPDTTAMDCPFDVQMRYTQPVSLNSVGQLGSWSAARQPFMDWLASVRLDLPANSLDAVFGDEVRFTVPCLKIASTP